METPADRLKIDRSIIDTIQYQKDLLENFNNGGMTREEYDDRVAKSIEDHNKLIRGIYEEDLLPE